MDIRFKMTPEGVNRVFFADTEVTEEIRTEVVNKRVSQTRKKRAVRDNLPGLQRRLGKEGRARGGVGSWERK
eukprot:gene501-4663_t